MGKRDLAKNFLAATGEPQQDLPPVFAAARSFQEAVRLQAIYEFHGAVMLDLKAFGKHAYRGVV